MGPGIAGPAGQQVGCDRKNRQCHQHGKERQRTQVDHQARGRYAQLSQSEREVLGLILSGLTNKEMGRALLVSPRTVEAHRANLFAKLEAESLAQLIRQYAALADEDGDAV